MSEKKKEIMGVGKNVLLLGVTSLLTDVSSEMIHPLLPLFIASIGGTATAIGIIGSLGEFVSSILKIISGHLSDKKGRQLPFVFSGYFLSSATKIFFAFSTQWYHVLILKTIERIGKGLRTAPRDVIIANSKRALRGRAFGIHRAMDTLGAVFGSILALILFFFLGFGFREIFLIGGFLGFLALIPLLHVKDVKRKPIATSLLVTISELPAKFKIFLIIVALFALGNFTEWLFILKAQSALYLDMDYRTSIAYALGFYILFNIFYAGFSTPAGTISDRIGRKKILLLGYFLFSIAAIGFVFFDSIFLMILLFVIYGLAKAFIEGTQRAFASDLVPESIRGTALGTFHLIIALATLPSGFIAGFLWDSFGAETAFEYASIMSFFAILLLAFFREDRF